MTQELTLEYILLISNIVYAVRIFFQKKRLDTQCVTN